jgi:Na+/serine symporter
MAATRGGQLAGPLSGEEDHRQSPSAGIKGSNLTMAPTNMLGLTTLGTFHTAISLIALLAGIFVAFVIGAALQVWHLRAKPRPLPVSA